MLLMSSRTPAPDTGSWSSARFDLPTVWTMGESRWFATTTAESRGGTSGRSNGLANSWSLKTDLTSLALLQNGSFGDSIGGQALPGGVLLADRLETPALQDSPPAPIHQMPTNQVLALDQYAPVARLYFVSAGVTGLSGEFDTNSVSLDNASSNPSTSPIGGGLGGGLGGGSGTPPDLGGSAGNGGIGFPATPEPSGAILTLIGLSITCGRRLRRR